MPAEALVLTYHRVAAGRDPLQQCVHPDRFGEQLDALARVAEIVPLSDLDRPSAGRRVALTFDDGYRDNATEAAPRLRAAAAPATFFVPARILGDPGEFWWDRLEHAHLDREPTVPFVTVEIGGKDLRVDVRSPAGVSRSLKALNRRLRPLPLAQIEPVVAEVEAQLGAGDGPCTAHSLLSTADVAGLAADPLFEIGGHGSTHTMLAALPRTEQRHEIEGSRTALEAATGGSVTSFAYPYGTPESFDIATAKLVRAAGYERACSNIGGAVSAGRRRYDLARHMVYDWPGAELAQRVRAWFESP